MSEMSFWKRKPQPVRMADVEGLSAVLEQLGNRLEELEERDALVKLEVTDWYEKFNALYARLNKRVAREVPEASAPREINPAALKILGGMK